MSAPGGRLSLRLPAYVLDAWREVIPLRRSRRAFLEEAPHPDHLEQLQAFSSRLPARGRARVVVVPEVGPELFTGIVGSYGRVTGAPSALLMIGLTNQALVETVGYVGEAAVLEATRLGLDTCWVGGFFRPEEASRYVDLRPGERVWAVSPLGYAPSRPGLGERVMKRAARSHRRRDPQRLTTGGRPEEWPEWARGGLELARLAPSAVNRQPWRFCLDGDGVVVEEDAGTRTYNIPKRLDCGIAMVHFEVGARVAGAPGEWEHLAGAKVARYRPATA